MMSEYTPTEVDIRTALENRGFTRRQTDSALRQLRADAWREAADFLAKQSDRDMGSVSVDYHTLDELYEYRMLYNAHAARGWLAAGIPVVKSWRHSDGEECFGGGWFIVTAELPTGQVSNHYPQEAWQLFEVPEVERAPEWDGHTSWEAAQRLRAALGGDDE